MEILQTAIQYASWPLVVLVGFVIFHSPIRTLISKLATIKAGSFEASFINRLDQQGLTEAQLEIVRSLSPAEIDIFLLASFSDETDFNYRVGIEASEFKKILLRLQDAGLLEITNPNDKGTNLRHNTTLIGKNIRFMLISSTMDLLHAKQ